jgi:CO/xanthine dehydrogenase Mo-binding subunit
MAHQKNLRLDGIEVITGEAKFGTDVQLPNMLYGKLVRSTRAHAKIIKVDTSRAKALAGVVAIITARDVPKRTYWGPIFDQPLFAEEKSNYLGEPIAAIAAEDEEIAEEAASLVEIEYEILPVLTDVEEAIKSDVTIHDDVVSKFAPDPALGLKNVCSFTTIKSGNVEKGFSDSDYVIEDDFVSPMVSQMFMEPHAAMASVTSSGLVTVWTSTQAPYNIRSDISTLLDIQESKIKVIGTKAGGGFGGKLRAMIEQYCVALSMKTLRPVKMVYNRFEELSAGAPQTTFRIHLKTGVKKDGTIVARKVKLLMDVGAYACDGPIYVNIILLFATGIYKVENVLAEGYAVYTNKQRCASYRGIGAPQTIFFLETHMARLAKAIGIDLTEFRLCNMWDNGYVTPWGQTLERIGLKSTFERALLESEQWKKELKPNQGIGIGCGLTATYALHPSTAEVKFNEDGSVTFKPGAWDSGTGALYGGLPILVAEELGLPFDMIRLVPSDTDVSPYNEGAQGSSTTYSAGNASISAAKEAKKKLMQLASEILETSVEDLELKRGEIVSKSSGKQYPIRDIVTKVHARAQDVTGRFSFVSTFPPSNPLAFEGFCFVTSFIEPCSTSHAVLVEVDRESGNIKIKKYVAIQDSGKVINPAGIAGQITGGATQGIGVALLEDLKFDDSGNTLNATLIDYLVPTSMDVPEIATIMLEGNPGGGPMGARGAGELPNFPVAAAIGEAIFDAVGFRATKLPITFEDIHFGLKGLS